MSKITVEVLQVEDFEWFTEVAAVRMLEDELKRPELVNMDNIRELATRGMFDGTAFVAKQGSMCVGAIGGLLVPNIFNSKLKTLAEVFWYVLPDYRNSRAGLLLLKAFEEKADEIADESTLCLLPSSTVNMGTLEKRGFYLSEFAFRRKSKE